VPELKIESPEASVILIVLAVIWLVIWLFVLYRLLARPDLRPVTKFMWVFVVVSVPFFGVLFYWFCPIRRYRPRRDEDWDSDRGQANGG
jgi:type VI protein secretion system component VasK